MKSSNIFQKLKSAGVGNPDGVPSAKPKLKLGVQSPAKMAKSPAKFGLMPDTIGKEKKQNKTVEPKPQPKKSSAPSAYEKALSNNPNLNNLIKSRKGLDKASNAYKKIQNQINKAYGVSKRYELTPEPSKTPDKTPAKTPAVDTPKVDKVNKAPKVQEAKTNVQEAKTNVKNVRAEVAETNKQARKTRRADKKAERIQKRADRKNARAERIKAEGGTRVGNFLRGKKKEESPAAMKKSPAKKALVGKQKNLPEHLKAKIKAAPGKMKKGSPAKAIPPALAAAGKKILVDAIAKKASSAMKMKKGAAMKMKYKK